MKFLVDMPLAPKLVAWLKAQGYDAQQAAEMGLALVPDREIFEAARETNSIIVTADLDYPRLLALTAARSPGLVLFRGGNYSELEPIDRLQQALETIPVEELPHSVIVIEKGRIRQRHLPF